MIQVSISFAGLIGEGRSAREAAGASDQARSIRSTSHLADGMLRAAPGEVRDPVFTQLDREIAQDPEIAEAPQRFIDNTIGTIRTHMRARSAKKFTAIERRQVYLLRAGRVDQYYKEFGYPTRRRRYVQ